MSFVKDSEFHLLENGSSIASLGNNSTRIAGSKHEIFGADCRFRDDPEEDSYDTAGLVVRVITGGLVVCGVTIATGGIATAAGAGASTVSAVMSVAAITGGMTVTGMAVTDYVSGHLSSYESYMKTALAGSIVGAMTGAAALVPVSGGWAHAAIDFSTGMAGDGVMQQAMTGEIDGEQMFASGVFSVFVGAFARKVGEGESGTLKDIDDDLFMKNPPNAENFTGTFDPEFAALSGPKKVEKAFEEIEKAFGKDYADKIRELYNSTNSTFQVYGDDLGLFKFNTKGKPIIDLNKDMGNAKLMANTILHETRHLRQVNKLGIKLYRATDSIDLEIFATSTNIVTGKRLGLSVDDLDIFIEYYKYWRSLK